MVDQLSLDSIDDVRVAVYEVVQGFDAYFLALFSNFWSKIEKSKIYTIIVFKGIKKLCIYI